MQGKKINIWHDYVTDYKTRLTSLQILPLMYWMDLLDIATIPGEVPEGRDWHSQYFQVLTCWVFNKGWHY